MSNKRKPIETPDLLISVDVEADGPIPGPYSMISIGACVIGSHDGFAFTPKHVDEQTFYGEMRPISDQYEPEALAVGGFTREQTLGFDDPAQVMLAFKMWLADVSAGYRPVFAAYPLGYDFMFTTWYLVNFAGESPFGHGSSLDMKSYFAGHVGTTTSAASKRRWPNRLKTKRAHTHNALDDAMGQGEQLQKMLTLFAKTDETVQFPGASIT